MKGDEIMYINIDVERVKLRMSLDELADKIGVQRKSIYTWQKNGKIPATVLIAMADFFGCSIDYLLGRTENRTVNSN